MTIILTGATGLIGAEVVRLLPPGDLHIIARRHIDCSAAQTVGPPETWADAIGADAIGADAIGGAKPSTAISALGTTRRIAGSDAAFRAVDLDLVVSVAGAALAAGASHFIMLSSVGASPQSSNFYLKTKGEAEAAVKALGFDRVDILRPGLLRGHRNNDRRVGERMAILISPLTDALTPAVLDQYRSISSRSVALAVAALTRENAPGVHIHHNRDILKLGVGR